MKIPRLVYLMVGLIIGIAGVLVTQRALVSNPSDGCQIDSKTDVSPNGKFRATLTNKMCAWGFGLAANSSSIKLEKLGTDGWLQNIELETDQPTSESPTMAWLSPTVLEVIIKSDHITGSIRLTEGDLHFVRKYVRVK
jgi:hypothetical protein